MPWWSKLKLDGRCLATPDLHALHLPLPACLPALTLSLPTLPLFKSQHGFTKGRSCLTNLLTFLEDVTHSVDQGIHVDVIYLDFAKAFDNVAHCRLIRKLEVHGIAGDVSKWIEMWLRGRKQRVMLNGELSDYKEVTSGVPQGSVLGPVLFTIFINDLDEGIKSKIVKFADDTKMYLEIREDFQVAQLQRDIDQLVKWSVDWQMLFNAGKCTVLHLGYNNQRREYRMEGVQLKATKEERNLGVYLQSDLKPSVY